MFAPEPLGVQAAAPSDSAARQAFQILYFGFIVAPIVAGLDKFVHLLVNWDQYLAPTIAGLLPTSPHTFMLAVGVVEVVAGGWVVAAWLWGVLPKNPVKSLSRLNIGMTTVRGYEGC